MKTIILEGQKINTEAEFHHEIATLLNFGDYYGNNLDALWDCLSTDVERPVFLVWENSMQSKKQLGNAFEKIVNVLQLVKDQDIQVGLSERFDFILR